MHAGYNLQAGTSAAPSGAFPSLCQADSFWEVQYVVGPMDAIVICPQPQLIHTDACSLVDVIGYRILCKGIDYSLSLE